MRYTYKKISGVLFILLAIMIISRVIPYWLFYSLIAIIALMLLYLLYNYSKY